MRDCSSKAAMASSWVRDATWCLFSLLDDKHHDHVGVLISAAVSYKFRSSGLREELPERRSRSPRRGDAFLSARGGGDDDIPEDPAWDCSGTHPPVQLCSRSHEAAIKYGLVIDCSVRDLSIWLFSGRVICAPSVLPGRIGEVNI